MNENNRIKYEKLIDQNCHGIVLETIAEDFKEPYYKNLFNSINKIHTLEGNLSHDLLAVRERIRLEFKNYLMLTLENTEYESVARYV